MTYEQLKITIFLTRNWPFFGGANRLILLGGLGHVQEADILKTATVHWLRHTGISEDIKHRPREHVRDDAGHSSGAITDKYIDVELQDRAESAKEKSITKENSEQ